MFMLKSNQTIMLGMWRIKEKRRALRICAIAIVSFCILGAAIDFSRNLRAFAATTYTTTIGVNDAQLGEFSTGQNCNGTKNTSYTGTKSIDDTHWTPGVDNRLSFPPDWDITACPGSNARFVEWQVNGLSAGITGRTINPNTLTANSTASDSIMSNTTNTITAVFEEDVPQAPTSFVIGPNNTSYGGINTVDGWCSPGSGTVYDSQTVYLDNSGRLDTTANDTHACAAQGYVFSLWLLDGEEISRNSQISKDFYQWPNDGQQHTLTAVFEAPSLSRHVNIVSNNENYGLMYLPSGNDYVADPDDEGPVGEIDVSTNTGSAVTDYLVAYPESGYFVDSVTSGNGSTTVIPHESLANQYKLSITSDDTVTVNFRAYSDVVYNISVNLPAVGSIDVEGGNCSSSTKTSQPFTRTLKEYSVGGTPSAYQSELETNGNRIQACVDDPNYVFDHWEIDNLSFSGEDHPSLDPVGYWPKTGTNHVLRAVFVPITPYTVRPNNPTLGGTSLGDDCNNSTGSDRSLSYYAGKFHTNNQSIRACPAQGASFVRWELDGNTYSNQAVIPYNVNNLPSDGQPHILRAVFESTVVTPYTVGSDNYAYGSYVIGYDCNSPESADRSLSYVSGAFNTPNSAPIKACPLNGNAFLRWELDGQPYSQNAEIPYNASDLRSDGSPHTLRAVFGTHNTVTVRPDNNSYGSIVGIEAGSGYTAVKQDSTLTITTDGGTVTTGTLTVEAAEGKVFIGFTSETGNTTWTKGASDEEYILTITGNDALTAQFRDQTEYYLDIQNDHGSNGGIDMVDATCASENIRYNIEESYDVVKTSIGPVLDVGVPYIRACPNEGFVFVHWKLDGQPFSTDPVLSSADEKIINDYRNHHITAFFSVDDQQIYSVTVQVDNSEHGSVNLDGGSNYSSDGSGNYIGIHPHVDEPITTGVLRVTPASGYVFDYFTSTMGNTTWTKVGENQYQLHLTDTDTVVAHFRPAEIQVRYIIGPDDDTHGAINTTQDSCGDESTRIDILTGLDSNQAIDIAGNYIVACPNTNYTFSHWELDGQNISTNASLAKNAQTWPNTGTHELRAIFVDASHPDYSLPYTGSASIWIILGGGIGLVLIPSIVLISKDYLEEKKGGKT